MKGVIIAGGFGTRMRPLTHHRPKHLLPVANRPFLEYQVDLLRRHGITEIIFATNYMAEQIEAHFGDGSRFGVHLLYALENEPLGTAGAIRNAAAAAPPDTLIVFNGDILTDFDLGQILSFHYSRGATATIALRAVERPHPFGVVVTDAEGRVTAWREPSEAEKKRIALSPGPKTGECDYINAGIYVLEPDVVASIPSGRPVSIERETYPALIQEGAPVFAVAPEGFWLDMGRPDQYLAANGAVLTGAVYTSVPFAAVGPGTEVAPDAKLDAATSVGANCRIEAGASLVRCIILDNVAVGRHADLQDLISDAGVTIGDEVTSRGGAVLASGSVVERGSRL
ncbi:MAG: sugar phosphate nucleotidyltransferase [Chthonomonadales bacterium]